MSIKVELTREDIEILIRSTQPLKKMRGDKVISICGEYYDCGFNVKWIWKDFPTNISNIELYEAYQKLKYQ